MELKDIPEAIWVLTGGALAWIGRTTVQWARGRKAVDAKAEATIGGAWAEVHNATMADIERLRAEMKERDRACDERMNELARSLRNDFEEQNLKLRSIIYSLAKKIPLDPKQRAILDSIAPEVEATK